MNAAHSVICLWPYGSVGRNFHPEVFCAPFCCTCSAAGRQPSPGWRVTNKSRSVASALQLGTRENFKIFFTQATGVNFGFCASVEQTLKALTPNDVWTAFCLAY